MTDKLEVLNHMLSVVGETPVSSPSSNHPTAISARTVLDRVNKQFQIRGWWFNTDYSLTLSPDSGTGEIILPDKTLRVDPIDLTSGLVRRGKKLYDPVNHTYAIGISVIVDLTTQLDVDELPESAALYLMHKAAYDFYVGDDGDAQKSKDLGIEVGRAWADLRKEEIEALDTNSNTRPIVAYMRGGMRQAGSSSNPSRPGGR